MKQIKYEDLKDLNYGDEIVIADPAKCAPTPYVYMSKDETGGFHFISGYGASFMIKEQATIDGFNVMLIDDQHAGWDQELSDHGKQLGDMLTEFASKDDEGQWEMLREAVYGSPETK